MASLGDRAGLQPGQSAKTRRRSPTCRDLEAVTSAKEPIGIGAVELEATIAARGGDRKKGYELFRKAIARRQ